MRILQLSTYDYAGGAEKIAWTLFDRYRQLGHVSKMAVGTKRTNDPDIFEIPKTKTIYPWTRLCWAAYSRLVPVKGKLPGAGIGCELLSSLAVGREQWERLLGRQGFYAPGTYQLLNIFPDKPDIVHAHNLHGGYFDLRYLTRLGRITNLVITLHDEWLLTGHCAYTLGCMRWQSGCGHCPDLTVHPSVERDATSSNWKRKHEIISRSRIHVAAPSQWLLNEFIRAYSDVVDTRLIPNGIDLKIFKPEEKEKARFELKLKHNQIVLLFVAHGGSGNPFKDYRTIETAIQCLPASLLKNHDIQFVSLGGAEEEEAQVGQVIVRRVPYQKDQKMVARYYQASDVFLHAARADNFPNTILEAMACGVPVVATAVGGITEQVVDGKTGYLVPPADAQAMSVRIQSLIEDMELRNNMSRLAASEARDRFDLDRRVEDYLGWYRELLDNQGSA